MVMKKLKKIITVVLVLALAITSVACGKKGEETKKDNKTLNIRVYKAGWGDEYVRALAAAFEQIYAEEGYKINIVSSDSTIQGSVVTTEMLLCENNGIDLYFSGGVGVDDLVSLSESKGVDMIAADLTDVYQSKPIKADGTEESQTVLEKMREGAEVYYRYNGKLEKYNGKYYTFGYMSSPQGFMVNKELLSSYGLEVPKTTDELMTAFDAIEAKSNNSGVHPTVWAGYNAYTYWYAAEDVWAAQYDGIEAYHDFLDMNNPSNSAEGWRVYESKGWRESLDVFAKVVNLNYAPEKTISMDHMTAQHNFLTGKAVFMVNGAWLQNEMSANYLEQAKKISMIKTPVISALGKKIGLANDTVLSQIVGLVDEGKTVDEIVASISGVTAEQAQAVKDARNIYYQGEGGGIIVNAYSPKVDIAKLFLRFIASDDAAKIMYEYASAISSYRATEDIGHQNSDSEFLKSTYEIVNAEEGQPVFREWGGMRKELNLINWTSTNVELEKVLASAKGKLTGTEVMDKELEYMKETWTARYAEYNK